MLAAVRYDDLMHAVRCIPVLKCVELCCASRPFPHFLSGLNPIVIKRSRLRPNIIVDPV